MILLFCAIIALMISVFIGAIIAQLSWSLFNPCCSSIVIGKNLFCFVTGNWQTVLDPFLVQRIRCNLSNNFVVHCFYHFSLPLRILEVN